MTEERRKQLLPLVDILVVGTSAYLEIDLPSGAVATVRNIGTGTHAVLVSSFDKRPTENDIRLVDQFTMELLEVAGYEHTKTTHAANSAEASRILRQKLGGGMG